MHGRSWAARGAAGAFLAGALVPAVWAGGEACERAQRDLVVHEWGTFTSVQGSRGVALEGLHQEEERLPGFVYSRAEVQECPLRDKGYKGLEVPVRRVTQKMETPVIYFHTKTPQRVRVRVDFVKGLISQWFPVTDTLGPPEAPAGSGPLDMSQVERSFLEWKVDLIPGTTPPAEVPQVSPDDPWSFAREVDAAWLRTASREQPRLGPTEAERYLFYRGLGSFPLPLQTMDSGHPGVVVAMNRGQEAIPLGFGLSVDRDQQRIVWAPLGEARPGSGWKFDATRDPQPLEAGIEALTASVQQALTTQGLHADEARAMVRTWARSWFATPGTRILWVVPRPLVDRILPLEIEPTPRETVRVLVGRHEVITPEVLAEVTSALRGRCAREEAARQAAERTLQRFGRLLEPHVREALAGSQDPLVQRSGAEVLAAIAGLR